MSFLYLNFAWNLSTGSKNPSDFYNTPLLEQYEALKPRLGVYAPNSLREFVQACYPQSENSTYFISMPSFRREIQERTIKSTGQTIPCINNIVLRAKSNMYSRPFLGDKYNVFLIGDISFGNVISVQIKGIDLVDANIVKYGERSIVCMAACAFGTKTLPNGHEVLDYGVREIHDAVLTHNFITELCEEVFPVPDKVAAMGVFQSWQRYLGFRNYYLAQQSMRYEEIVDVVPMIGYVITKELYRNNEDTYQDWLLDGIERFSKGEQVVLSRDVPSAEELPLIRVTIDKNLHEIMQELVGKRTPKYERHLQRFTGDSMALSSTPPEVDEKANLRITARQQLYMVGERYLFSFIDVSPDCSEIEQRYAQKRKSEHSAIEIKYKNIIEEELKQFKKATEQRLLPVFSAKLQAFYDALAASLEQDIKENKDKEVHQEIDAAVQTQLATFKTESENAILQVRRQIDQVRNDRKLTKDESIAKIAMLTRQIEAIQESIIKKEQEIRASIDIRSFYENRNAKLREKEKKSTIVALNAEVARLVEERRQQLSFEYRETIQQEKTSIDEEIQRECETEVAQKVEYETIRRYHIYFRAEDATDSLSDLTKQLSFDPHYLIYDNRAERMKIERQERALRSLMEGYVKNPYLASYLFAPQSLEGASVQVQDDIDWCLESLNDRQRLAVKRAIASDSIFLLQGPPGTGKTQVIAEITAQLVKQGKKVLISSETHKAIDNVFDRLPKIAEIRPLRLIPSTNKKETNYRPERLVDNFYMNIRGNLQRQISLFEHYQEMKESFSEQMGRLRVLYSRLITLQRQSAETESARKRLVETINEQNIEKENLRELLATATDEVEVYRRTIRMIESYRFVDEGVKTEYVRRFYDKAAELLRDFSCFDDVDAKNLCAIVTTDINVIKEALQGFMSNETIVVLENKRVEIRKRLAALRDPDTDEAPVVGDPSFDEYKKLQSELKRVVTEINEASNDSDVDVGNSILRNIVSNATLQNQRKLALLLDQLTAVRIRITEIVITIKQEIVMAMLPFEQSVKQLNDSILSLTDSINQNKQRFEEMSEDETLAETEELSSSLKQAITRFFRDFNIVKEYHDIAEALDIIGSEWRALEQNNTQRMAENRTKIPMYQAICKYLASEDILEEDRRAYTKLLFDNVNVFGITCTSRDKFTKKQLIELETYGIDSVDIRAAGIDVVIVDEVSKSSFLDLLIPILYGKTIILVGDHRQLPPMYDLRHMREQDFEGLDERFITKQLNDQFTKLYEECYFKTLYEHVPDAFRVMLNKQYRCHSHIMEVFNHFYGGARDGLQVGRAQQDNEKQHGLTVRINNNTLIDPQHHIYFVDCPEKEASHESGTTSIRNEQEALVVMELLRAINRTSQDLVNNGKTRIDAERGTDERPSVGVICTYGDQAGLINRKKGRARFEGFSQKIDERFIVSTVDDFQGDERDIIIVSMVRNPRGANFDLDFIKKFERINVAFSRARKLLIIVGAKKFLAEKGVIELPDLEGNHAKDKHAFPVYREIIDTIGFRGRILTASDVLGEGE